MSRQRVLREATIEKVIPIEIDTVGRIWLAGKKLRLKEEWNFAHADGFNTPKDMYEWFAFNHGLPFKGVVIYWGSEESVGNS